MPLEDLTIDFPTFPIPNRVSVLLDEADERIDQFFQQKRNRRLPRFIPSDAKRVYCALKYILDNDLLLGNRFCEWGSGYGVSACLASFLDFDAFGIEIETELVDYARKLAADFEIDVEFYNFSYLPEGFGSYQAHGGHHLMPPPGFDRSKDTLGPTIAYEDMDFEIEEIDLFYVYPWPEEQELMMELFESVAADGALLLAYFAPGDLNLYQKVL